MKNIKLIMFIFFTAIFIMLSGAVYAAYHNSPGNLICSDCHTMHYSQENTTPAGGEAGGPWENMLISSNPLLVCLSCHDDNSRGIQAPDVVETDSQGLTERAGGKFADPEVKNPNGHNISAYAPKINGSSELCMQCHFGGSFTDAVVTCVYCHDPHGNDKYRNLRWATNPDDETMITALVNPAAEGLAVYERANVRYNAPATQDSNWREVTNICLDCHHVFSGDNYTDPNGDGIYTRHPVLDSERGAFPTIGQTGADTDVNHWIEGSGEGFSIGRLPFIVSGANTYAEAGVVSGDNSPFCLTCHKAHGSDYKYGLRWAYTNETGEGCQQCHNK